MNDRDDRPADAALVARTLAGEREAFGPLLLRYYGSVERLCRRLLGATPEAQDIAQEAALQSFLGLAELGAPERFGAWLHAIAANLARMELRRRRTLSLDMLPEGSVSVVLWTAAPQSPEVIHAAREVHDTIVAALNQLSGVNREVVIGFYLQGYSYDELALILGVPVSTIKGRLFKGRRQLRQRLGPTAREVLTARRQPKELPMNLPDVSEVEVEAIHKSRINGTNVVVLRAKDGSAVLPIWIGGFEAEAIAMILQQRAPHRPITHDLSLQMIAALGGQVRRVTVSRLDNKTFFAEIELVAGAEQQVLDARPSDAIALAVRVGAPIFVARAVLDTAGAPSMDEWSERHAPELAGQGPLARTEPLERNWALQLVGSPGTPEQSTITLAEFTSSDWPSPQYQRGISWDGRDMLAIALPSAEANPPWLIVPPDFWEREATTIIRPTAPGDPTT
jgi:RNA polymerase sigma factor (sigma-70 family)